MKKPRLAAESQTGRELREARLLGGRRGREAEEPINEDFLGSQTWVGLVIQRIEHEGIDILKHHGIHRLGIEADLVDRDCTKVLEVHRRIEDRLEIGTSRA